MAPRTETSIRRELARVKAALRDTAPNTGEGREQYGAMQALEWALRNDAAPPSTLARTPFGP